MELQIRILSIILVLGLILISGCVEKEEPKQAGEKGTVIIEPVLGDQYIKIYQGIKELNSSMGYVRSEIELTESKESKTGIKYVIKAKEIERIPNSSIIFNPEIITTYSYFNEKGEGTGGEDDVYVSNYSKPLRLFDYPLTPGKEWEVEYKDNEGIKGVNNSFEVVRKYHFKVESFEPVTVLNREYVAAKVSSDGVIEINDVWGFGRHAGLNQTIKSTTNKTNTYWITSELGIIKNVEKSVDYINSKQGMTTTLSYSLSEYKI
jgi:hypothetical protein